MPLRRVTGEPFGYFDRFDRLTAKKLRTKPSVLLLKNMGWKPMLLLKNKAGCPCYL